MVNELEIWEGKYMIRVTETDRDSYNSVSNGEPHKPCVRIEVFELKHRDTLEIKNPNKVTVDVNKQENQP